MSIGLGLLCTLTAAGPLVITQADSASFRLPVMVQLSILPHDTRPDALPSLLLPEPVDPAERWAPDALVATDREAGRTGTIVRRPRMAAGLSLRLISDDGGFVPELAMSGPAGRALARLAVEAGDF